MGRPSKQPTAEQRLQVAAWSKARVAVEEIARRIGLAPKTLRKHFAAELGLVQAETVITREITRFVATPEQREMALILAGARWPRAAIATELGICIEVLEEHFATELSDGPVKFPAPVIRAMWFAAKGGNVSAAKVCLMMNAAGDPDAPGNGEQPSASGMMGKKQQALLSAKTAAQGTPWEDIIEPSSRPN